MASSSHLTRQAKELRDTAGISLSEAKRRLSGTQPTYPWELLGITDISSYDPTPRWEQNATTPQLQLTAGTDIGGTPIVMDLADQRLGGHGPHWLIQTQPDNDAIDLLGAIAADLGVRYSPDRLEIAVLDATGALEPLRLLPHVHATGTSIPLSQWTNWLELTSAARSSRLQNCGAATWAQYQHLSAEVRAVPEMVVIAHTGTEQNKPFPAADLTALADNGIHLILCTPREPRNAKQYISKLQMTKPHNAEQAEQAWAQLKREHPHAQFVGEPALTPAGAGILDLHDTRGYVLHNYRGNPTPPLPELERQLRG